MNKRELAILEKAFAREVDSAFDKLPHLIQVRGKLVDKMVAEGLLNKRKMTLGGRFPMTIEGYELTDLGRLYYCASCDDEPEETSPTQKPNT